MSNNLTLSIPFSKVDQTRRVVTGYATAENIDPAGDLIEYSASQEAFSNWVGNIREMHAPKAVGKAISYRPVMVPYQGREYRGFEVDAYISKGAQDTWEKILDGTLKGFSVGGKIVKSSNVIDKSTSQSVRHIEEYELNELSLVDNMGNPAAAVTMVKMASDGSLSYDLVKYQVFYCDKHGVAKINNENCDHGDTMREVGIVDELDIDVIVKVVQMEIEKASDGFSPPQGARSEARKGLEWRKEFNRGGTAIGVARARDLSNGRKLPLDTINRMVSYFARHEVDKKGQGWSPGEDGFPSPGRVAWALWGGDAGRSWANSISDRMKKESNIGKNISQIDSKNNLLKENIGGNMDLLKDTTDDTVESMNALSENAKIGLISKFITWVSGDTSSDVSKSVDASEGVLDNSVSSNAQAVPNVNIYVGRNSDVEKADQESSVVEKAEAEIAIISVEVGDDSEEGSGTENACPDCGCSSEADASFCKDCGTALPVASDSMTKSDNSDEIITDGENDGGNEMDIEKLMEGIGSLLDEKISKLKEEVVSTVDEKFAEITKSVDDKFEGVEDRVEKVESAGAVKKSVDESLLDEETVIEKKAESFWGGIFVPAEIAEVLGYES